MEEIKQIIENIELKNLKKPPRGKNGGKRPGAGMPKGKKIQKTLVREEMKEKLQQRVLGNMQLLLDSQFNLAKGVQLLYKISTVQVKTKDGKWREERQKPELVTDRYEIEQYLSGEYDSPNKGEDYYFITTKEPENKAIDSLLDRVFGKAPQTVEVSGNFQSTLKIEATLKQLVVNIQANGKLAEQPNVPRVSGESV